MIIPVSEWTPDLTPQLGDTTAANVIPDVESYRPWNDVQEYSSSISARCQGAIAAKDNAGINYNYAGDATNLYVLSDKTWAEASRTTSASYTTASTEWWEFVQWGGAVIGTNGQNEVQEISLGGTHFANIAGAPPVAKHIAIVRDFVVLGNISGSPQRVRWCAINNSHSWTVDATTLADYQDLLGEGGHVQKIVGGDSMMVFQERAIWRGQFVGSPQIFDFGNGPVEKNLGAYAPQSVASYEGLIFYLSADGFMMWNGAQSEPIGAQKVDRTFFADLDSSNFYRVQGVVDSENKLYMCAYPGSGNTNGNPNRILVYNFAVKKWSLINGISLEILFRMISTGYTLETLDTISTNIDTLPASLDSSQWTGGQIEFGIFNTSHRIAQFTGDQLEATVTTHERQLFSGQRAHVNRVRPLVNMGSASVAVGSRNILSEDVAFSSAIAQQATGDCPVRSNARYHRFQIVSDDFDQIQGVEVLEATPAGSR